MPGLDEDAAPDHKFDCARPAGKAAVFDGDNVCDTDAVAIGIRGGDLAVLRKLPFDVRQPADPDFGIVSSPLQILMSGFLRLWHSIANHTLLG